MTQDSGRNGRPPSEEDGPEGDGDPGGAAELEQSLWLVRRAQEGDPDAMDRVFAIYYMYVLAVVRARLGQHLRQDLSSMDVAQEAMYEAVRGFPHFRIDSTKELRSLLATIVVHRIRAHARSQKAQKRDRRRERDLDRLRDSIHSGAIDFEPAGDEPLPLEILELAERRLQIDEALNTLRERDQLAIRLRDYEGYDWSTVADRIDSPTPGAARMVYSRALIDLKLELQRRGLLGPD